MLSYLLPPYTRRNRYRTCVHTDTLSQPTVYTKQNKTSNAFQSGTEGKGRGALPARSTLVRLDPSKKNILGKRFSLNIYRQARDEIATSTFPNLAIPTQLHT